MRRIIAALVEKKRMLLFNCGDYRLKAKARDRNGSGHAPPLRRGFHHQSAGFANTPVNAYRQDWGAGGGEDTGPVQLHEAAKAALKRGRPVKTAGSPGRQPAKPPPPPAEPAGFPAAENFKEE